MRKYKVQCRHEIEEDDDEENKPLSTAKILYVKGLSEEMRILGSYNIRTVFRTMETLGRILTKVKDLTPPEERPGIEVHLW